MADESKARLVQLCEARGIPLIEDDIYGDIHFAEARPRVAKAWDRSSNVLLCSSFTKNLAPGLAHRLDRARQAGTSRWRC